MGFVIQPPIISSFQNVWFEVLTHFKEPQKYALSNTSAYQWFCLNVNALHDTLLFTTDGELWALRTFCVKMKRDF